MGGGDLNLKKSWHPQTLRNVERVWKAEQKADAETKKIEQLQRELLEERAREEMQRHAVEHGISKKKSDRLDWMYSAPGQINRDEYLLGKPIDKHVDPLAKEDEGLNTLPGASFMTETSAANNASDLAAKVRDDPLFMIKKKEEEKKKELLNNPVKMKALKQMLEVNLGKSKKKKEKKKKRKKEKREKSRKRRGHDSEDSSTESEEEDRRRRTHREESDRLHPRSNGRKESFSSERRRRSRSRSHSPVRRKYRKRSPSPDFPDTRRKHSSSSGDRERSNKEQRNRKKYRSPSPAHRDRSRSPVRNGVNNFKSRRGSSSPPQRRRCSLSHERSRSPAREVRRMSPPRDRRQRGSAVTRKMNAEELEKKRQEMLENAQWHNEQRVHNVKKYKVDDEKEAEAEKRNSGRSAEFISSMKVESFSSKSTSSVSDRIKRNINSVQRTTHDLDTFLAKK